MPITAKSYMQGLSDEKLMEIISKPIRIHSVLNNAYRRGKSEHTLKIVGYALASGKSLLIGTSDPDAMIKRIREQYPDAPLNKVPEGVEVNGKAKK